AFYAGGCINSFLADGIWPRRSLQPRFQRAKVRADVECTCLSVGRPNCNYMYSYVNSVTSAIGVVALGFGLRHRWCPRLFARAVRPRTKSCQATGVILCWRMQWMKSV